MSMAIENCAGKVFVFGTSSGGGGRTSGFYALDPEIPSDSEGRALILGIPLTYREIVQPVVALDDSRTLYVFGSAWNDVGVHGVLLLGTADGGGSILDSLLGWYDENRVGKKMGPVSLSVGPKAVDAFVVGLVLEQADPVFNKQMFSIRMVTADT